ncbi:CcmD family protein [candidate division KSB1 bacterium]|nr:MAG: CcmD family protein [candidate division KSB1 bacterium]RKY79446.1 MAG: CcmD family protein [candidate division KSB1 bacterium]RKY88763.1 MAG: CcmD family protein [candidate division KSB1 bacterium]
MKENMVFFVINLVIWIGIFLYLLQLNYRVKKLEKKK